jgi:hypothetical protein
MSEVVAMGDLSLHQVVMPSGSFEYIIQYNINGRGVASFILDDDKIHNIIVGDLWQVYVDPYSITETQAEVDKLHAAIETIMELYVTHDRYPAVLELMRAAYHKQEGAV